MSMSKNQQDYEEIVADLKAGKYKGLVFERKLFEAFYYFIEIGIRRYSLNKDDAFNAYSDTILHVIQAIQHDNFKISESLRTSVFLIFKNKCHYINRLNATKKKKMIKFRDTMSHLPDESMPKWESLGVKSERLVKEMYEVKKMY
jgi:hypothetical protein